MGRGLGPGIGNKLIDEFHVGPKKLENSRAQPPPTSPSNGYARVQNILHRAVYHRCIGSFMQTSSLVTLKVSIVGRPRAHTVVTVEKAGR